MQFTSRTGETNGTVAIGTGGGGLGVASGLGSVALDNGVSGLGTALAVVISGGDRDHGASLDGDDGGDGRGDGNASAGQDSAGDTGDDRAGSLGDLRGLESRSAEK